MGQLIYIYLVKTRRFNIKNKEMTTKRKIFIGVSVVVVIGLVVMLVKSSKGVGGDIGSGGGINYDTDGTCKYMGKWVRDSSNSVYLISGRANGKCVKVHFTKLIASGWTPLTSSEIWAQSEKIEDGWLGTLEEG